MVTSSNTDSLLNIQVSAPIYASEIYATHYLQACSHSPTPPTLDTPSYDETAARRTGTLPQNRDIAVKEGGGESELLRREVEGETGAHTSCGWPRGIAPKGGEGSDVGQGPTPVGDSFGNGNEGEAGCISSRRDTHMT